MQVDLRIILIFIATACRVATAFDLTILHTNDVHARFDQFDKYGSSCDDTESAEGKCFGGVARRVTKVREIRAEEDNVILLDGGDQFQGTMWFYLYKGIATSHFMNAIGYDVMTLGNHEFDNGPTGLRRFLQDVNATVLSSNIDASQEPEIDGLFKKSTVLTVGGKKIGVIGYTYSRTPEISTTGKLIFSDEVTAIQAEVDRLVAEENIDKIIALGHAGYDVDLKIAQKVRGIDIVVGGHTNTFLYTGTPPSSSEVPAGEYPTVVLPDDDPTGNVLVVQDYTLGKYLGRLDVTFDDEGKVTSWGGNPILLDKDVAEDPATARDIDSWGEEVRNCSITYIGSTNVFLDGDCRLKECNLGNMLADAYVHHGTKPLVDGVRLNDVTVAIFNSGSIRSPVPVGDITLGDLTSVLPFGNTVDTITIKGVYLLEALEHAVAEYNPQSPSGEFLQLSGLLVSYDLSKSPGHRVAKVEVRCTDCLVPEFVPLVLSKVYPVILNTFTVDGGDGYTMIRDNYIEHNYGNLDLSVVSMYIERMTPLTAGLERRIIFLDPDNDDPCSGATNGSQRPIGVLLSVLLEAFIRRNIFL